MRFSMIILTALLAFGQLFTPIELTMRDGKTLAADVYSLDTTIAKPVILIQTPYNKLSYRTGSYLLDPEDTTTLWDLQHYNFVAVDWRGFYASSDADSAGYDRGKDGYDCVEEIATRAFCNGRVGTYGGSALGDIQFRTAKEKPPHLVCAAPWIKDQYTEYEDYYYGGVLKEEHMGFLSFHFGLSIETITSMPLCCTYVWEYVYNNSDWMEDFEVPMFMVTGWFDHYPGQIIRDFHEMRERTAPSVRDKHKLMIGPWLHGSIDLANQGEFSYPGAAGHAEDMVMLFFDHYLRDAENGYEDLPVGQYYIMPDSIWFETDDWYSSIPGPDTLYFYGDGGLLPVPPAMGDSYSEYTYDPRDPTPSYGGERFDPLTPSLKVGPWDIRDSVESREDVVIFTTPPLESPITVLGTGKVVVYVSSDREDTDFAFRLTDVYPDGSSYIINQGIRRGRLYESYAEENLLTPGEIYEVEIPIRVLAKKWKTGHRLRLVISSANWPMFHRNLNNGGPMYEEGDSLIATNRIYHDASHPSMVVLPIVEEVSMIAGDSPPLPQAKVLRAYPNPFNSATLLPNTQTGYRIYDIKGRKIATSASNIWRPAEEIDSGLYFARAREDSPTIRLLYLK